MLWVEMGVVVHVKLRLLFGHVYLTFPRFVLDCVVILCLIKPQGRLNNVMMVISLLVMDVIQHAK